MTGPVGEATGAIFIVLETQVHYRRPARLDDLIEVSVELRESGRASLNLEQVAWRADEKLAEGRIRIGCVDAGTFRPQRIPTAIASVLR